MLFCASFRELLCSYHLIQRESILQELVLSLILAGQYRKALDELELYAFLLGYPLLAHLAF